MKRTSRDATSASLGLFLLLLLVSTSSWIQGCDASGFTGHGEDKPIGSFVQVLIDGGTDEADAVQTPVVEVDSTTLNAALRERHDRGDITIAFFYASWCGHCKRRGPMVDVLARDLIQEGLGTGLSWIAMDCDSRKAERDVCARYDANRGFPTFIVFDRPIAGREGEATDPTGYGSAWHEWADTPIDGETLRIKVNELLRPDVVELPVAEGTNKANSWIAVQTLLGSSATSTPSGVVVFASSLVDPRLSDAFVEVAHKYRDHVTFARFGDGSAPAPSAMFPEGTGLTDTPTIWLYKPYEKKVENSFVALELDTGDSELNAVKEISDFVLTHKFPLAAEITGVNWKFFVRSSGKSPVCFIFATPEQREEMYPWVAEIARTTRRRLNLVFIDWETKGANKGKLGIADGVGPPAVAIENATSTLKWAMPLAKAGAKVEEGQYAAVTRQSLGSFVSQWMAGEIEPSYLSEKKPDAKSLIGSDGIMHLVNRNFNDEVINNNERDVFVKFYAPWCSFCKKLAPVWQDLAARLKESGVDHIVMAKIDRTLNDLPLGIEDVTMYPTLRYYKAGSKGSPIVYSDANKTIEALQDFLMTHSSKPFQLLVDATGDHPDATEDPHDEL